MLSGTTVGKKHFRQELDIIEKLPYNNIKPDDLVVVSSFKEIKAEQRYLICNGEIVDYDCYEGSRFYEVKDLVQLFYEREFTYIKEPFVIDVSLEPCRIIEINSFNCAGLYSMNSFKIIESINNFYSKVS